MPAPTITTPKAFLTRSELAERWNVSLSTIKRREASGELRPARFGLRLVRYSMAHIHECENPSTIEPCNPGVTPATGASTGAEHVLASVGGHNNNRKPNNATSTASRKN